MVTALNTKNDVRLKEDIDRNWSQYSLLIKYGQYEDDLEFKADGADVRVSKIRFNGDTFRTVRVNGYVVSLDVVAEV